jgi:hypothetical protein
LAALKSRKRKQIRKERARAAQAVAEIRTISGQDFDRDDLTAMERFYRSTTRAHGGTPYLHAGFFAELHKRMPENMMLVRASDGAKIIAGASYLHTPQALYGRYWGCTREHEFLHFELAYYRGIEWAIGRGIPLFEAGAQGEQKLLRGFEPRPTYSSHWMRHSGLANAVDRYLAEEKRAMHEHMRELATYLPYRSDGGERESC